MMIVQPRSFLTLFLLFVLQIAYIAKSHAEQDILSTESTLQVATVDQFGEQLAVPADIQAIFKRMNAVIHTKIYDPQLAIIKTSNTDDISSFPPQALSDGSVVISDKIVALIQQYGAQNPDLLNALMAFVIGHELAHFENDDLKKLFGHFESKPKQAITLDEKKAIELSADKKGFLYAAFAGYKVGLLVKEKQTVIQFLEKFFKQNSATDNHTYPTPEQRAAQTITIWETLQKEYMFYEYGVRLSVFDQCNHVSYFLNKFRHTYQGKEVQNNMGVCYLQLAKADMQDAAYFYWLPGMLDGDIESITTMGSTVTGLKNLKSARLVERVKGNLEKAISLFDTAIRIAPYYLPSYLNSAIAYLYIGDPDSAALMLNKGLRQYEQLHLQQQSNIISQFKMLQYLARYENTWTSSAPLQDAINGLKQILEEYENPPIEVQFNLARLLEVGERSAEAQEHWNQLAKLKNRTKLPKPILEIVCNEQEGVSGCLTLNDDAKATKKWLEPEEWSQHKGIRVLDAMKANRWQKKWHDMWHTLPISIYHSSNGQWEALLLNGYPDLLVNKNPNETLEALHKYCPHPLRKKSTVEDNIYLCENWAAKVIDNQVTEVWIHR